MRIAPIEKPKVPGTPVALFGMLFSVVYIAFARSASRFGESSMAIVGIANRIEALQFVTSQSIGTAGADRPKFMNLRELAR